MLLWFHALVYVYVCICAILLFIFILSCLFLIYFLRLLCCGPFLKSLLIFTILLLFYVLVFWPWGMWDPNSPTQDGTHTPCIGRWSLNHWTAREVSIFILLFITYYLVLILLFILKSQYAVLSRVQIHVIMTKINIQSSKCSLISSLYPLTSPSLLPSPKIWQPLICSTSL